MKNKRGNIGAWTTPEALSGLNNHLVMYITVGNYANTGIEEADKYKDKYNVRCLVEDMEFTVESQYSTPFAESDPQSKLPSLHAMLSTGTLLDMGMSLGVGNDDASVNSDPSLSEQVLDKVEGMMHKTSFSKVNSTQIYGSSTSMRMSGTILLVAWDDAKEVESALKLLQSWTVPTFLSKDSTVVSVANETQDGWQEGGMLGAVEGMLDGLYHSVVPPVVAIRYGGKVYSPFYIENVSAPMSAPMNDKGERIAIKVQITFISRQAWDRSDIEKLYA